MQHLFQPVPHQPFTFFNISRLFSILLFCSIADNTHAQKDTTGTDYFHNTFQLNIGSLFFNNYNFSYERLISRKISVVGEYRFMPSTAVNKVSATKKILEKVFEDNPDLDNAKVSNNAITAGIRFYTGSKPGARGFYFQVYGRYAHFNVDYPYTYEYDDKVYTIPLSVKPNAFGGGIMIGAQWLIAKRLVLDWYILGAHYGSMNGDIAGPVDLSALPQEQKEYMQQDINGLVNLLDKQYINVQVTDRGVNGTLKGPFIGVRGGISLGVAF